MSYADKHWIEAGRIYGPAGFTGYVITNQHRIVGRRGDTRHWIYQSQIYARDVGNTGYRLEENKIHGPAPEPPWYQQPN